MFGEVFKIIRRIEKVNKENRIIQILVRDRELWGLDNEGIVYIRMSRLNSRTQKYEFFWQSQPTSYEL